MAPTPNTTAVSPSEGYATQAAWQAIQKFLPEKYQLSGDSLPTEEWWSWRGHSIHLDRYYVPNAPARVILFHGVGTNGRQMSTILGRQLAAAGIEAVATDMPPYGVTKVAPGAVVKYSDWVEAGHDFVAMERARDPRPIVLYGLSAGGMLAYHVAAADKRVAGVVGMTFLDQRIKQVQDETAFVPLVARFGNPAATLLSNVGLGAIKVPMKLVSKMYALVNNEEALQAFYADTTSAGNWVPLAFLSSYATFVPAIEPEEFDICPILLTQPEQDRWTPQHLSDLTLDKIVKVNVTKTTLENAGHYPLEEPGLTQMNDYIQAFVHQVAAAPMMALAGQIGA